MRVNMKQIPFENCCKGDTIIIESNFCSRFKIGERHIVIETSNEFVDEENVLYVQVENEEWVSENEATEVTVLTSCCGN